jgi:hypothetical protein
MSYSPAKIGPDIPPTDEVEKPLSDHKPAPSWFAEAPARDLAEAYRARRELREREAAAGIPPMPEPLARRHEETLEDRFQNARRMFDSPERKVQEQFAQIQPRVRRPVLTPSVMPSSDAQPKAPPTKARHSGLWSIVSMGALAVVVGSAIGFGYAKRDVLAEYAKGKAQEASVSLPNFKAWTETPVTASKKEVSMASLDVNDARGTLNSMIPLMLHAAAADASTPIDIKISGLPPSAYLSAGKRSGISDWTVKTSEIDGLKLVVPAADQPKLDLEVAALDQKSGALAAPVKSLSIALDADPKAVAQIQPVSAPPDTSGNNFNTGTSQGLDYLAKGDALMKTGDIASARQFYMKANDLGNPKGAYGVARTYDPKVFAELNVQGLQPDSAQAADWYKKAAAAGVTTSP